MAVIWRQQRDGVNYEVRTQGRTVRLFANGVQHSEYHPERLVTGSVWDLLWLPALLHPPGTLRRVLVLGLGGGSLIPPLMQLLEPEQVCAVDLDPVHLEVAQRFFDVSDYGIECHCADAVAFAEAWRGPRFDLVIEDLFPPADRTVSRAVPATGRWFGTLSKLVSDTGMLVMNFGDWAEYRDSWTASDKAMRGWKSRFRFSTPDCHNAVMAWSRQSAESARLRERLKAHPLLSPALDSGKLDYRVTKLL